jgi:serine protease
MQGHLTKRLSQQRAIGLAVALCAALLAAAPAGATSEPEPASKLTPGAAFVPGQLLVSFKGEGERVLTVPDQVELGQAARALRANPSVSYAEPNYIAHASASVPNDPGRAGVPGGWRRMQWNFLPCGSACGQSATPLEFQAGGGIDAIDAWHTIAARGLGSGKGVRVAVLDTGIAYRWRKPRFRKSPDFARKQFLRGFDFVKNNKVPLDRDGHGTHVAGTIAERKNNGIALTGLAPGARIMPVRVLDADGLGTARNIARGIRFAAKHRADVINMSFEFSSAVHSCKQIRSICRALKFATKRHGAVAVAAAGNSDGGAVAFPARIPRVIGVGRTTEDGCASRTSRTGVGLDLVAPGGGIPRVKDCGNDLVPDGDAPIYQLTFKGFGFRKFGYPSDYEGTSMAAAHVSGVAAMVISSRVLGRHPSRAAVECQLERTARDTDSELGQPYDRRLFGAGLVDAAAAVASRASGC